VVLFAIHNIPNEERTRLLTICSKTPARVRMVPDVLGDLRNFVNENVDLVDATIARIYPSDNKAEGYIPIDKVALWLSELGQMSQAGDLIGIQSRLQRLQNQIETSQLE